MMGQDIIFEKGIFSQSNYETYSGDLKDKLPHGVVKYNSLIK